MAIGDVKKGAGMLIKAGDGAGSEVFTTIARLRTTSFTIDGEEVEVTSKDSAGFKELLDGAGTRSFSFSGSGVFDGSAQQVLCETRAIAGTIHNYQVVFTGGRTYELAALISSVQLEGEHNGEMTYSVSLSSSGQATITAEA